MAAFIVDKSNLTRSESTIITISAAVKWLHSLLNIEPNPVDSPLLKQIVISQRKSLHKPPEQKAPLTFDHVKAIVEKFANPESSLIQLRTACYVSLMFSLLFRHDEMLLRREVQRPFFAFALYSVFCVRPNARRRRVRPSEVGALDSLRSCGDVTE